MNWFKQYRSVVYILVLLAFAGGLICWLMAARYQPNLPQPATVNRFSFKATAKHPDLSRYQSLLGGRLFFGNNEEAIRLFRSNLTLLGLIKGKPSRALLGNGEESQETWIVKIGDLVNEERVVAIGDKYVVIRNQSGEGRVYLKE